MIDTENDKDTENDYESNNILRIFINILVWFSGFNILKVIFESNSLSINKKNHINIKCSLLDKTLHYVKTEIFSIKLWRNLPNYIQWLYFLQTIKMKYNFSDIIYHVHGYWKWFAEINDSAPLHMSQQGREYMHEYMHTYILTYYYKARFIIPYKFSDYIQNNSRDLCNWLYYMNFIVCFYFS